MVILLSIKAYSRAACLLATVFARRCGYRCRCSSSDRCWPAPCHRGATCGHCDQLFHCINTRRVAPSGFFDNVVARRSSRSRRFSRSSVATWLPFVDCHVLRVYIGNHGGHDRNRRDRHCIVVVVSTTMQPLSRLSCHSHALFRHAHAAFVARAALPT